VIFDLLYIATGDPTFGTVAYWMITSGILGGLLAGLFGWIDWFVIPSGTRAKSVGLMHGLTNVAMLVLFAASWYLRYEAPANPPMVAAVLGFVGVALSLVGGWLGGELVERLGIAVHEGAHPDAPSSLYTDDARGQHSQVLHKDGTASSRV